MRATATHLGNGAPKTTIRIGEELLAAIELHIKIQDFLAWLGKQGSSPADVAFRNNIEKMLSS